VPRDSADRQVDSNRRIVSKLHGVVPGCLVADWITTSLPRSVSLSDPPQMIALIPAELIAVPGAERSPWAVSDVEKPRQDRGSTIIDFVGLSKHGLALAINRVGLATDNRAKSASSLSVVLRFKRRF
jgi:hypothetical protein